ncbi:hypothetical protein [Methylobacterium soli]|uniref:Uncharacterized protein n=1 Tax=Methylobacterium soli TaxID=553447 RepID=A0A6L3T0Y7_9HYPH|nr:hypothetical protein [Methylobacterium soli]KAB1080170.1 hypothetical protein F6X53_08100 [Methylobacterium soli]GJE46206.1 hypothetical protein AEGHOMDF_5406 [Methylobacterium soli]
MTPAARGQRDFYGSFSEIPYRSRRSRAPAIRQLPNRVMVTGYTASDRLGTRPPAPPWELSAGRARVMGTLLKEAPPTPLSGFP